ncbi:MAG: GDP-mannose 4,6-dehydratase [Candidatus Aenigmarchaeota archaeon]|nr:GDP-mannose 4,6-dehydratase [Candidatus Aenigmarchaeota archaeon]
MNVLITGGNGFIGSHLAEKLMEEGDDVVLFDRVFNDNSRGIDCRKIKADIRDYAAVKSAVSGMDAVIHFAAVSRVAWGQERPRECIETNSVGTANVLEAVRDSGNSAYVFLGSSREVYGEPESLPVNETHPKNPISIYGISKLSGEKLALSYRKYFKTKIIIFRFSNVYGSARDLPERVVPNFVISAVKNKPLKINGGSQVLDFTFLGDTIDGIIKALRAKERIEGSDFHFVTGRGTSVKELADIVLEISGSSSTLEIKSDKSFDVRKFVGDYSKAKSILGWYPKTSLEEGIKKTIEAYSRLGQ